MKVYKFTSYIEKEYAILRPSSKENIKEINLLDVWWDSWGSNGNKIGDFTFCYGIKICKLSVFNLLQENFKDIKGVDVKINKTERELKAKNPKRLKWLPQEDIALKSFFSPTYFDCLPQSSLVKPERGRILKPLMPLPPRRSARPRRIGLLPQSPFLLNPSQCFKTKNNFT